MANVNYVDVDTGAKKPYAASMYSEYRGYNDYSNAYQFAPYEGGYCFLVVFGVPKFMNISDGDLKAANINADGRQELLKLFCLGLEREFKSFNGITDVQGNTIEISDGKNSVGFIGSTTFDRFVQWSVGLGEKDAAPYTNFIDMYLGYLSDHTGWGARTYGGVAVKQSANEGNAKLRPCRAYEVFTIGVGFTDSSMLNLTKGYILANSQPLTANWSELTDFSRGSNDTKELNIQFNGYILDGKEVNGILQSYIDAVMNNSSNPDRTKINLNTRAADYNFCGSDGKVHSIKVIRGSVLDHEANIRKAEEIYGNNITGKGRWRDYATEDEFQERLKAEETAAAAQNPAPNPKP